MKKITLILFILQIIGSISYAQPGSLDNTFGTDGKIITTVGSADDYGNSVAIQGDGKIVVAGYSYGYDFSLIRYNTNGTLDNTFGNDGKVSTDFGSSTDMAFSVVIQGDSKIVVAGKGSTLFTDDPANYDFALARYNSNGSLDNAFGSGGKVLTDVGNSSSDFGYAVALQNDGKIVVAGRSDNGLSFDFALVRYNSNGTLDSAFGVGGKATADFGGYDIGNSVAIQSDGKIVVAGFSSIGTNDYNVALVRYTTNGSLDNTFDADGKVTTDFGSQYDYGNSVVIQSDGKIIVAGSKDNGNGDDFALARYNTDGTLDNTFDSDGKVTTLIGNSSGATSVILQADGKIVAAGHSYNTGSASDFALARYNSDGTLDITFDTDGKVITDFGGTVDGDYANSIAIQGDGKIVVAGQRGYYASSTNFIWDVAVARYNSNNDVTEIIETEDSNVLRMKIYPNPNSGIFSVVSNRKDAKIKIQDVLGNCLLEESCNSLTNQEINLSCQPEGIYFVELLSGDERVIRKVAIQ